MFLEVQVQNISSGPLLFSKLHFGPAEGLEVQDLTMKSPFPVQPGDILQCLYIVKPIPGRAQDLMAKARLANNAMGLGRLDIRWSGRMGDTGHLTTSQLVRRLPPPFVPAAVTPRPALQPSTSTLATPDRSFRSAVRSPSPLASPRLGLESAASSPRQSVQLDEPLLLPFGSDIQATLYTLSPEIAYFAIGKPFDLHFKLVLSSTSRTASAGKRRRLRLAAQHVDHHLAILQQAPLGETYVPTSQAGSARQSLETSRPLPPTPRRSVDDIRPSLPPPCVLPEGHPFDGRRPDQRHLRPSQSVRFFGNSLLELSEVYFEYGNGLPSTAVQASGDPKTSDPRISIDSTATDDVPLDQVARKGVAKRQQSQTVEFSLQYIGFTPGIHTVGGVRIVLLEDSWIEGEQEESRHSGLSPCSLVEHSIVAEVVIGGPAPTQQ